MNKIVNVVDSMMGTGKTTAMINKMIEDETQNYIFVTIYKTEIQRVIRDTNGRFCEPENRGSGKLDDLHKKLQLSKDIAMTHALLLRATEETIQLIRDGNYILVLDEVLNVFQEYNEVAVNNYFEMSTAQQTLNKPSVSSAILNGQMQVDMDSRVVTYTWDEAKDTNGELLDVLSKQGSLRWSDDLLFVEYPISVFDAFSEIYVLTYMYEHSILAAYFYKHQYKAQYWSAKDCQLVEWYDDLEGRRAMLKLINVYVGVANKIGSQRNAFSVTWLRNLVKSDAEFQRLLNSITTFNKNVKAVKEYMMITTSKDENVYRKFQSAGLAGYTLPSSEREKRIADSQKASDKWYESVKYYEDKIAAGDVLDSVEIQEYKTLLDFGEPHIREEKEFELFVSCTMRATNMYRQRKYLIYLINRYMKPEILTYFKHFGYEIDEDKWAVSEMLQWIFRGQIRDGKPVDIYIPSSRMRRCLFEWAGMTEAEYIRDVLGIQSYRSVMRTYEETTPETKKGRPAVALPENWDEVMAQLQAKQITARKAMELTGLKKDKFYEFKKEYENQMLKENDDESKA